MVGLNDKESKQQEISTIDAYKVIGNILARDCTITEGRGVYTHEDGTQVYETSLVVDMLDFDNSVTEEYIIDVVERIKDALNQESVAYQEQNITSKLI